MLLIFDFGYAAWRMLAWNRASHPRVNSPASRYLAMVIFILALALVSYLMRMVIPLGRTVLDTFPTMAYLPQYLSFFVLGVIASGRNWFRTIPNGMGGAGLLMALAATGVLLPVALTGTPFGLANIGSNFVGNGHWQSAVYALWDSVFAVGVCLGLITLFRRFLNRPGRIGSFLSRQSYPVYIIHVPLIVLLAVSLKDVQLAVLMKFTLAAAIGLPLCFVLAYLVRRIPSVSRVL